MSANDTDRLIDRVVAAEAKLALVDKALRTHALYLDIEYKVRRDPDDSAGRMAKEAVREIRKATGLSYCRGEELARQGPEMAAEVRSWADGGPSGPQRHTGPVGLPSDTDRLDWLALADPDALLEIGRNARDGSAFRREVDLMMEQERKGRTDEGV